MVEYKQNLDYVHEAGDDNVVSGRRINLFCQVLSRINVETPSNHFLPFLIYRI